MRGKMEDTLETRCIRKITNQINDMTKESGKNYVWGNRVDPNQFKISGPEAEYCSKYWFLSWLTED